MLRALEYCHVLLKLKPYAVPGLFRAPHTAHISAALCAELHRLYLLYGITRNSVTHMRRKRGVAIVTELVLPHAGGSAHRLEHGSVGTAPRCLLVRRDY